MPEASIDRNYGDREIHSISFMNGSAYFKIFDPFETTFFTLIFHSVGNLLFETNHTQNVIKSIRIFSNLDEAKNDPIASSFVKRIDQSTMITGEELQFAYISPITGGETIISFKRLEMSSERRAASRFICADCARQDAL